MRSGSPMMGPTAPVTAPFCMCCFFWGHVCLK